MNPERPQFLYTVCAVYSDASERLKRNLPVMQFSQIISADARKANAQGRKYADSGLYSSVEVKSTKNNRTVKIL